MLITFPNKQTYGITIVRKVHACGGTREDTQWIYFWQESANEGVRADQRKRCVCLVEVTSCMKLSAQSLRSTCYQMTSVVVFDNAVP